MRRGEGSDRPGRAVGAAPLGHRGRLAVHTPPLLLLSPLRLVLLTDLLHVTLETVTYEFAGSVLGG